MIIVLRFIPQPNCMLSMDYCTGRLERSIPCAPLFQYKAIGYYILLHIKNRPNTHWLYYHILMLFYVVNCIDK